MENMTHKTHTQKMNKPFQISIGNVRKTPDKQGNCQFCTGTKVKLVHEKMIVPSSTLIHYFKSKNDTF